MEIGLTISIYSLTKFEAEALQVHNELRAKHGCPPLKIDKKLSKLARNWAVV